MTQYQNICPPIEGPLTIKELEKMADKRIKDIEGEFRMGFEFIKSYPKSVTFLGSARFKEDHPYYEKARSIARRVAQELCATVVTGGGPGIMEAANRGAKDVNGHSIGFTIKLPSEQIINPYVDEHRNFYYFFIRRVMLTFSAEAYLFFPGGFGTLNEFFDIITLIQTKKIPRVPIILVGDEYWKQLDVFFKDMLFDKYVAIDEIDRSLFTITEDEDKIMEIIKKAPLRKE